MDPITLAVIATIVAAGGGAAALVLLARWLKTPKPPQLPPAPEPKGPAQSTLTDEQIIANVLAHVSLSRQRIIVGHRPVLGGVIGHELVEPGYITGRTDIRPMRDISEIQYMLPGQDTGDDLLDITMMVLGERLVEVPIEEIPIRERIQEPVYEWAEQIIYLLVDISPSMYPSNDPWKTPIWRGICVKLLQHAQAQGITVLLRFFDGGVSSLHEAREEAGYHRLSALIKRVDEGSYTNITGAINTAMEDLTGEDFDDAEIMIITDGEDNSLSAREVRERLDAAGIKLHAVMLGQENQSLAEASHRYQRIPRSGVIEPLRKSL